MKSPQKAKHETLIIIPAFNEEESIAYVIQDLRAQNIHVDILVINDGSTDSTAEVAQQQNVFVLNLPFNLGIGAAVQAGYLFGYRQGYKFVGRLDADGQHNAADLPKLLAPIQNGKADVVIGSRYLTSAGFISSKSRAIGIKLFSFVVSLITRQRFTDTTSGLRMVNENVLPIMAKHLPSDYPEIESLVMLSRAKFRIIEVPVTMKARYGGQSSITPLRSIYYVFKVLLAIMLEALRKPPK